MPDTTPTGRPVNRTAPNGRPLEATAPYGHSTASHRAHGYCSACPGIEMWEELVAWRARDNAAHGITRPDRAEGARDD